MSDEGCSVGHVFDIDRCLSCEVRRLAGELQATQKWGKGVEQEYGAEIDDLKRRLQEAEKGMAEWKERAAEWEMRCKTDYKRGNALEGALEKKYQESRTWRPANDFDEVESVGWKPSELYIHAYRSAWNEVRRILAALSAAPSTSEQGGV